LAAPNQGWTYCSWSQIPPGECLVTVLRNLFGFIVVKTVVLHGRLKVLEVLRCFNVVDVGPSEPEKVGMELLPF
jgi:hypothetical protein